MKTYIESGPASPECARLTHEHYSCITLALPSVAAPAQRVASGIPAEGATPGERNAPQPWAIVFIEEPGRDERNLNMRARHAIFLNRRP